MIFLSAFQILDSVGIVLPAAACARVETAASPYCLVNNYGLFAVMTAWRPGIVVGGGDGGACGLLYGFRG
jgi:hypothetical protein